MNPQCTYPNHYPTMRYGCVQSSHLIALPGVLLVPGMPHIHQLL
jgi:hypothetical protein